MNAYHSSAVARYLCLCRVPTKWVRITAGIKIMIETCWLGIPTKVKIIKVPMHETSLISNVGLRSYVSHCNSGNFARIIPCHLREVGNYHALLETIE